jgi:hemoglobin/transferrin/lactoferrin receptor protein
MDLDDNIVPIVAGENEFARANQDSLIQGVEFSGEYLLDDFWSVYGQLTYSYGINEVIDAPLSRIPPTQGIVGLRRRAPDLRSYFAVYTWLVGRQDRLDPVRDLSDERIPPGGTPGFATLNLRMGRSFGACDQHRVSLSLENLTDKAYLLHGSGVYGTGFTARFGYQGLY